MNPLRVCRFCGCDDDQACRNDLTGETCAWMVDPWLQGPTCDFCFWMNPLARMVVNAEAAHALASQTRQYDTPAHLLAKRWYDERRRTSGLEPEAWGAGA